MVTAVTLRRLLCCASAPSPSSGRFPLIALFEFGQPPLPVAELLLRKALAKMRKAGHKRAHDMHIETAVGYDRTAPKRAINVSLNDDLVRQARLYTRNLSGTLEDLLQDFVERERARRRAEDVAVNQVIDGLNAFHLTHGLLSDEFSSL